jgi:hypothetical protein
MNISSEHKFDSGTGWPSFFSPYSPANIASKQDFAIMYPRTEVHCAKVIEISISDNIDRYSTYSSHSVMHISVMSLTMALRRLAFVIVLMALH